MTDKNLTIKTRANLFRIWRVCQPVEWDLTATEIAERLGNLTPQNVGNLLRLAGWQSRVRVSNAKAPQAIHQPYTLGTSRAGAALANDVVSGRVNATVLE